MNLGKVHTDLTAVQLNQKAKVAWSTLRRTLYKPRQNPQYVFGYMAEIALPILEAYHSDLYRDVENLQTRNWEEAQLFYYCVGKNGTNVMDKLSDAEALQRHGRENVYKFTYTHHPKFKEIFQLVIERMPSQESNKEVIDLDGLQEYLDEEYKKET